MQNIWVNNLRILRIKNEKLSGYYFYMNQNIQGDFQICICVPLMKTIIPLKKHVTKLCSLTFPLYNHLSLRIPFFHSRDKKNLIEFSEPKIQARTYIILLLIALLLVKYAGLKYLTKANNTKVLLSSTKLHCFIYFYH